MAIDLRTQYGSLKLKTPIIVGACSLTAQELFRIGLVSAGAGAIVLPCIFEEQFCHGNSDAGGQNSDPTPPRLSMFHSSKQPRRGAMPGSFFKHPTEYLDLVRHSSANSPIPIIASLNGPYCQDWSSFAYDIQTAGAAAIELHFHFDFDAPICPAIEDGMVEATSTIKSNLEIPLFLKLDRNTAYPCYLAKRLADHVDGVVLFGQSPLLDIDLDRMKLISTWPDPHTRNSAESLALIRQIRQSCPLLSIAANGGIETPSDLIKVLMVGADAANVTSAIYRQGTTAIGNLKEGLIRFMEAKHLVSLDEMRSLIPPLEDSATHRAEYINAVTGEWDGWENTVPTCAPFFPHLPR